MITELLNLKCKIFHREYVWSGFPMEGSLLEEFECRKCGRKWDEGMSAGLWGYIIIFAGILTLALMIYVRFFRW
jgi:hypothetical protein